MKLKQAVEDLIQQLDPQMEATNNAYMSACVMFSALFVPADEGIIARELGYDAEFTALVANRLRTAKIWDGGGLSPAALARWDGEDGGVSMLCDVNVAVGDFMITMYVDGEPQYSMSSSGRSRMEKLLGSSAA